MLPKKFQHFLHQEYSVGILLIAATVLAMVAANSPLAHLYDMFLHVPVQLAIGPLDIHKPLLLWINDGLMALFFLLIGLEVKYEIMKGDLGSPKQIALPGVAAIGGIAVPALIYAALNYSDPIALRGWAIPAATDIAFAVGVLALLGTRIPPALKIFLLALAIIDDLGAIIIIALFYTSDLSTTSIILGAIFTATLILMNRLGVTKTGPYLFIGALLWVAVLKSGVHATLAGVVLALTIPLSRKDWRGRSPLKKLERQLHGKVNYIILPIFAFANAGIELSFSQLATLANPIPMGILLGLFVGKQLGVFSFSWLAIKSGLAKMPANTTWLQLYGLSILCGIGFTMSLFVGALAFEGTTTEYISTDRIGILAGSFLSAIVGYVLLRMSSKKPQEPVGPSRP